MNEKELRIVEETAKRTAEPIIEYVNNLLSDALGVDVRDESQRSRPREAIKYAFKHMNHKVRYIAMIVSVTLLIVLIVVGGGGYIAYVNFDRMCTLLPLKHCPEVSSDSFK